MLRNFVLLLAFSLPAVAQAPVPKAYPGGDYWVRNEHTWMEWEVCCKELVVRQTPQWPADDQEPSALLHIDWKIGSWPVLHKFNKGEVVQAYPDPVGGTLWKDLDGSSWLRVQTPDGRVGFVRGNAKFVKPVARAGGVSPATQTSLTSPGPNQSTIIAEP